MYSKFKLVTVPLADIFLDERNPRIVLQERLDTQEAIVKYLFEYEDLDDFIRKITKDGKNPGAERPYIIKTNSTFTVIEGNTRIAAYKLLCGLLTPPKDSLFQIPMISDDLKKSLIDVDCTLAPNRESLLPVMANAHFGQGDKSKWGYLGSRKVVYDEWKSGKTIGQLSRVFARTESQIRDLIIEYSVYLHAINLDLTEGEKSALLNPSVEFNPPIRFLQTSGHKDRVGIKFDTANLAVVFDSPTSRDKFKHLIKKLVINPSRGLGATASYDDVFQDYKACSPADNINPAQNAPPLPHRSKSSEASTPAISEEGKTTPPRGTSSPGRRNLFNYNATKNNALIAHLMKEAREINCSKFPAASTALLRTIVEAILRHIIDESNLNQAGTKLDLETSINICLGKGAALSADDRKILKLFKDSHLDYLNLGAHGNVIPNLLRLSAARDCIEMFVKRNT
ncbi:hypothetical protein HZA56_06840 [Candidatus Poribacteria bacterium]|nr:hypothetical protein [Candidatus Poribacteria bacterium]